MTKDNGKPEESIWARPIKWKDEPDDNTESLAEAAREAGKGVATEEEVKFFRKMLGLDDGQR